MVPVEHRLEPRVATTLSVRVVVSEDYVVPVRIRNVSSHGLFVESEAPFPRNAMVRIELPASAASGKPPLRIPAYVVHTTDRGAGLMLTGDDEQCVQVLRQLVREAADAGLRWRRSEARLG